MAPNQILDPSGNVSRWSTGSDTPGQDGMPFVVQPAPPVEPLPVGSIFHSRVNTDPAILLGYGTWAALGGGFLAGYLAADPDFGTPGMTGGAKTLAIADHSDHTHAVTTNVGITTAVINQGAGAAVTVVTGGTNTTVTSAVESPAAATSLTHKQATTGAAPMPILPPFLVVYIWERIS